MSQLQPLSVYFIWHPADNKMIQSDIDYCAKILNRNSSHPFSRSINLPVFNRTSLSNEVPKSIPSITQKTIVFAFISKEIMADDNWREYVETQPVRPEFVVVPVALDVFAFKIKGCCENKNHIRAFEFKVEHKKENLFLSLAHEIYRLGLNDSFDPNQAGVDTSIKLFLSHAKDGKQGVALAKALKYFIDNSPMRDFFDATDIGPGYSFDQEIIRHIKNSTFVAIHSDLYSSRFWCQKEIECAKESKRPIIAVDCLDDFEDRRYPHGSNIPSVRLHIGEGRVVVPESALIRVMVLALQETVRYFYSKKLLEYYKRIGLVNAETIICPRPPELLDAIYESANSNNRKQILYSEPVLYKEEEELLAKAGLDVSTPLTINPLPSNQLKIGISISEPSEKELILLGHTESNLKNLSQDLARHFIAQNNSLIYGGDLRLNGFTQIIFEEAQALKQRLNEDTPCLENHIAWPIYLSDATDINSWKANYFSIAKMHECSIPPEIKDLIPSEGTFIKPIGANNSYVWAKSLSEMRKKMIKNCNIRICAGGRHSGYKGKMPGVLEEILIAIENDKPLFLIGGFGGVTQSVCNAFEGKGIPEELTLDWQKHNNQGYNEMLNFVETRDSDDLPDYSALEPLFKIRNLKNGLSDDDNKKLFKSPFVEEVIHLVFKGIRSLYK